MHGGASLERWVLIKAATVSRVLRVAAFVLLMKDYSESRFFSLP